ncbi:MAG: STAS/SEC14 domain-containing protein [Ardenticatenaceae bacterium]|nr:STAS/SEC14 domain-containing protein [Ardenticatenaceae bacterium]
MTTVQLQSEINIELEKVLDGVAKLDTPDLEKFLTEVSVLLAQRKVANFSKEDARLLQVINQMLPVSVQTRYDQLTDLRRNEKIAPEEYQELLRLVDQVELADANRLAALIELAQLRHLTVDQLMQQLDIQPPSPYVSTLHHR